MNRGGKGKMVIDSIQPKNSPTILNATKVQEKIDGSVQEMQFKPMESQGEKKELSKDALEKMVDGMNQFVKPSQTALHFEFHEKLNEYYVQIVDSTTREVVKEIPSRKFLDMYASMMEYMGLFVDQRI